MARRKESHGDVVREVYRDGRLVAQLTVDEWERFWIHLTIGGPGPRWILAQDLDMALRMISVLE